MSGSAKKQIVIDHGSLTMGTNNTTLKRQKKVKPPVALLRPSTLKQNLLKKIKEHQQRNEETPSMTGGNIANGASATLSNQDLSNQFKMSTNYLEQLISKKKDARKHNKKSAKMPQQMPQQQMLQQMSQQQMLQQMPQQMSQQMPQQVSLELPPELQINPIPSIVSAPMQMMSMTPIPMPMHASQESNEIQLMQPQQLQPQQLQPQQLQPQQLQPPPQQLQPQQLQPQQLQPQQLQQPQYSNPTPIVLNDVPYGCLRGGNKPTYRTYHRIQNQPKSDPHNTTLKKSLFGNAADAVAPISDSVDENADPMIQERQRKLREIQSNFQAQSHAHAHAEKQSLQADTPQPQEPEYTKIKNKIKQTITKKYKLGKTAGSNVVGVLIKNSDTRRCIQEEHGALRRESIVEIRKYLHDHGMIKVGSDAPPDVLRNIYESAKMTGDVNNTNKHVMLHNFLKSDENTALD